MDWNLGSNVKYDLIYCWFYLWIIASMPQSGRTPIFLPLKQTAAL